MAITLIPVTMGTTSLMRRIILLIQALSPEVKIKSEVVERRSQPRRLILDQDPPHISDVFVDDELKPVALDFMAIAGEHLRRELQPVRHEQQRQEDVARRYPESRRATQMIVDLGPGDCPIRFRGSS